MYKKVDTTLNFVDREKEVLEFWRENKVFEKTKTKNGTDKVFTFYDGPPTANGKPHIGHVLTRVMKDIIPRYKIMKGYSVLRKAGWDTHGLPVELEVEKLLGIDGKQEIEKYGIEPFVKQCKQSVWKYKSLWEQMSERIGYWVDMDTPYVTYDNDYIESVWWAIKTISDKGLLYEGHKIVPYCPRCGTALSSHEVAQGYKDVEETTIFVKFKAADEENTYFLAWTTTPWTLPSNVALCVNPKEKYVKVEADGVNYILAEALVKSVFGDTPVEVKQEYVGKDLEYKPYQPLFDFYKGGDKKAWYVTCDDYVTLTDGSGIVHIAPAFGEDDSKVGLKYGLPLVQTVDDRGKFKDGCGEVSGMFCKDADKYLIRQLKARGLLFKEQRYTHSYPFCWRCDTPLLYYARKSWFIKMSAMREELLKANDSINWMPATIKDGRMGNFLENVIDWGISRERYWGTPLPIWRCNKCGKIHVIGSREELAKTSGCNPDIELHRPYIDAVTWKCECGGEYKRVPEVVDCWLDSGSMPFAQHHYPFENKEVFERNFPADFISEAVDQTRGWFYTLMALGVLLFGKAPFKNCIVLGHVCDKNGLKMSKHKGNTIDPQVVLDGQGADATRWYFYTASAPWLPSRFYPEAVQESQRQFLGTLWNTYAFFVLYADIDKYDPSKHKLEDCKLSLMDRWILSELNTLIKTVDKGLENYEIVDTARAIQNFTDNLSNWYVRRGRDRYWGSEWTEDKKAAYTTLYTVLVALSKLAAPFVPFVTEQIYQNLVTPFFKDAPVSVHLCDFPVADERYVDEELQVKMNDIMDIVVLGRSARNNSNIKNRQPLSKMFVIGGKKPDEQGETILKDELNVKAVEFGGEAENYVNYELKPQLKTLGPKYGSLLGAIRQFLATCNASEVVETVKAGKVYKTELNGKPVEFSESDLLISSKNKEGYVAASDKGITVVLDTNLTPELLAEGMVREFVSKIQSLRKESGFVVTDHIKVEYSADEDVSAALKAFENQIKGDTLCDSLVGGQFTSDKTIDVNGHVVNIKINKI